MSYKKYREISKRLKDLQRFDDAEAYRLMNERSRMRLKFLQKYGFLFLCAVAVGIVLFCVMVSFFGI